MPAPHHSVFTGRMFFLPPNQQRQSTEGKGQLTMEFNYLVILLRRFPAAIPSFADFRSEKLDLPREAGQRK